MAAALAQCALDQEQDSFWKFHNALYKQADESKSQDDLIPLSRHFGLDAAKLKTCAYANTYQTYVPNEENLARSLGLPGNYGLILTMTANTNTGAIGQASMLLQHISCGIRR